MGVGQGTRGDHLSAMTFEEAFSAYEAVRARLPTPVPPTCAPTVCHNLEELADEYDAFLLDAFGVLNIGETAIPGVAERIADLRALGKRVLVVSNAAGFPHHRLVEKYARLGYDFETDDILTSRKALAAEVNGGDGRTWGLMISDGVEAAEFESLSHVRLKDEPSAYDKADGILMIGSATWTEGRQALLEAALTKRPRPVYVGNPDIVAPREVGFSTEPGQFAHRLADRTGISPIFCGKPFPMIFDLAFERLPQVGRDRILMVGDSLHTDILGAQAAGIASALVTRHGFFAGQDIAAAIARSGICPDHLLDAP